MRRMQLTKGSVLKDIINLIKPMIAGNLSWILFGLVDTYFLGWIGTDAQAAISFAYPVILVANSITMGVGLGTAALIATSIGEKDADNINTLATNSIVLMVIMTILISIIGIFTIKPVFKLLGATEQVLNMIRDYMIIWYIGLPIMAIPMLGNNIIRAIGNIKIPCLMMIVVASINMILDPIFIMGLGPVPKWGIKGAAIATICSRLVIFCIILYILIRREKIVSLASFSIKRLPKVFGTILKVGVPNALSRIIIPIGAGVITGFIARFGTEAVAGFGVGCRIEQVILVPMNALSAIIVPFIGQNNGAKKYKRIEKGVMISTIISLGYGTLMSILLIGLAEPTAKLFNPDMQVVKTAVQYLHTVSWAYGFQGLLLVGVAGLNALQYPMIASGLSTIQFFVIYLPVAFVLQKRMGMQGIFVGLLVSQVLSGSAATGLLNKKSIQQYRKHWLIKDKRT